MGIGSWELNRTVALAAGHAVVFGLLPALRTSRVDLAATMKEELSPRSGSRERLRNLLVVAQVAVSLVLLVGVGLVLRSLAAARTADTGFDATNVLSISADIESSGFTKVQADVFHAKSPPLRGRRSGDT